MPFWPGSNQLDGSVTKLIYASDLLEAFEHNKAIGLKIDPIKQAEFEKEVIGQLTELSNPVIMRIK